MSAVRHPVFEVAVLAFTGVQVVLKVTGVLQYENKICSILSIIQIFMNTNKAIIQDSFARFLFSLALKYLRNNV